MTIKYQLSSIMMQICVKQQYFRRQLLERECPERNSYPLNVNSVIRSDMHMRRRYGLLRASYGLRRHMYALHTTVLRLF